MRADKRADGTLVLELTEAESFRMWEVLSNACAHALSRQRTQDGAARRIARDDTEWLECFLETTNLDPPTRPRGKPQLRVVPEIRTRTG
jgi:hypothetical protein